jgi:hypothetical protein
LGLRSTCTLSAFGIVSPTAFPLRSILASRFTSMNTPSFTFGASFGSFDAVFGSTAPAPPAITSSGLTKKTKSAPASAPLTLTIRKSSTLFEYSTPFSSVPTGNTFCPPATSRTFAGETRTLVSLSAASLVKITRTTSWMSRPVFWWLTWRWWSSLSSASIWFLVRSCWTTKTPSSGTDTCPLPDAALNAVRFAPTCTPSRCANSSST